MPLRIDLPWKPFRACIAMHYIFRVLKHLDRIRSWTRRHGADMDLNAASLTLTIQLDGREVRLSPRFVGEHNGSLSYFSEYRGEGNFIGWLPYEMKRWDISTDKRLFKQYALSAGLRVPATWSEGGPSGVDFIIKPAIGSFGMGIRGPYGIRNTPGGDVNLRDGEFFEQFINGRSAKAWYWNGVMQVLEVLDAPYLIADGKRSLQDIAAQRRGNFDPDIYLDSSLGVLAYQGYMPSSVPAEGTRVMLDFRYLSPYDPVNLDNRNILSNVSASVAAQFGFAGPLLYRGIDEKVRQNSIFTVDAVVDGADRVWFLEMNSHPMVHPDVYPAMLDSAFRQRDRAIKN